MMTFERVPATGDPWKDHYWFWYVTFIRSGAGPEEAHQDAVDYANDLAMEEES